MLIITQGYGGGKAIAQGYGAVHIVVTPTMIEDLYDPTGSVGGSLGGTNASGRTGGGSVNGST